MALFEQRHQRHYRVCEDRVRHGHVDVTPLAVRSRVHQRGEYAHDGGKRAAEQVGDLEIRHHRLAVARADLVQHAGIADIVDVVAGSHRVRPVLAVTGDSTVDDARVDRRHRIVVDAELLHDPGAEAFDDDIGALGQSQEDLPAAGLLQVLSQRQDVAVHRAQVIHRLEQLVPRLAHAEDDPTLGE